MSQFVAKKAFLAGLTCRTQGWFTHHTPDDVPGPGLQWRFWIGSDVGERARPWLGAGLMLRRTPLAEAAADSAAALADPAHLLLFEATFLWNGLVARADALRRHGSEWDLIEVKSGKTPEEGEKIKAEYLDDIAYTYTVAAGAGLKIARSFLLLISRDYRLDGDAEPFGLVDVSDLISDRVAHFTGSAPDVVAKATAEERPEPEFIFDCKDCDFFESDCLGQGVPDPLFAIPRISRSRFEELKVFGRIADLPKDADLTDIQRGVVDVMQAGVPKIDASALRVLDRVQWPAKYLDFESVMPHFPWFAGCEPYETLVFQYSLHELDHIDAAPRHREYLAPVEGDWRRDMVESMLRDLGDSGSIIVYSSYEKTQLKAMAKRFPDLSAAIDGVIARLFDLEQVFKNGYIHPGFMGRTSIKKVLPVMVPDLTYATLEVNNGDDALGVFGLMRVGATESRFHATQRERLLEYCKLDTLAMVRVHQAVHAVRGR